MREGGSINLRPLHDVGYCWGPEVTKTWIYDFFPSLEMGHFRGSRGGMTTFAASEAPPVEADQV
jgi:hypothetical protein